MGNIQLFRGISSPDDVRLQDNIYATQKLIDEIEAKMRHRSELFDEYIYVSLQHEKYSKDIRDVVAGLYVDQGWSKVEHMTSSENNERPGITAFKLYW